MAVSEDQHVVHSGGASLDISQGIGTARYGSDVTIDVPDDFGPIMTIQTVQSLEASHSLGSGVHQFITPAAHPAVFPPHTPRFTVRWNFASLIQQQPQVVSDSVVTLIEGESSGVIDGNFGNLLDHHPRNRDS